MGAPGAVCCSPMWTIAAVALAQDDPSPIVVMPEQVDTVTFTRLLVRDDDGTLLGQAPEQIRFLALDELRAAGHDVRGAESVLFGQDDSADADYLLGGTVTELDCDNTSC